MQETKESASTSESNTNDLNTNHWKIKSTLCKNALKDSFFSRVFCFKKVGISLATI